MKTLKQILEKHRYLSINLIDCDGMNAITRADIGFKKIVKEWLQQKRQKYYSGDDSPRNCYKLSLLDELLFELEAETK